MSHVSTQPVRARAIRRAERALAANQPANALEALRALSRPCVRSRRIRVRAHAARGHWGRALRVLMPLIAHSQSSSDMLLAATVFDGCGNPRRAVEAEAKAWAAAPQSVDVAVRLTDRDLACGRVRRARKRMLQMASAAPEDARVWAYLGTAERRSANLPAARRALRRAVRLGAEGEIELELAGVCRRLRRLAEAERQLRSVIGRFPRNARAFADLGDLLACERRAPREAMRQFDRARKLAPEDPEVQRLLARDAWRRGAHIDAVRLVTKSARAGHSGAQYELGWMLLASSTTRDRVRGRRWLERAARGGEGRAALCLAVELEAGDRIAADGRAALAAYVRAAHAGEVAGQLRLAQLYAKAQGVPRDFPRAAYWYEEAAKRGDPEAACALGELHDHGFGRLPDPTRAAEYFRKAARRGHARAQFNLGVLEDTGELGERDVAAATAWFRRAARRGSAGSEFYLGMLYATGDGVERRDATAVYWLERAARRDHAPAQYQLALLFLQGRGGFDDAVAARWLTRAATLELEEARHLLGFLYRDGRGVPIDSRRAYWWFSLAAHQGFAPAQVSLGVLLLRGDGVAADAVAAAHWFERAAEAGDPGAQRRLGHCYATGLGIDADPSEAFKWLTLAIDAGDTDAQRLRDSLAGEFSARARFEGRVRAHAFALERDVDAIDQFDR